MCVLDFPKGCDAFDPPHTLQCYESLWKESDCALNGIARPSKMTDKELRTLRRLDLWYVNGFASSRIVSYCSSNATSGQVLWICFTFFAFLSFYLVKQ